MSASRQLATPIVIGAIVAVGALSVTAIALTFAEDRFQPPPSRTAFQSIDIEMPKTTFQVGERLNFTINTSGMCASPNVTILRYDETNTQALKVHEYTGAPIRCRPLQAPDEPHLKWEAERLEQRFYDDYFGGDGNSVITTSAAITLKKAGNYIISASLLDMSKSTSTEFTVIGNTETIAGENGVNKVKVYIFPRNTRIEQDSGVIASHLRNELGLKLAADYGVNMGASRLGIYDLDGNIIMPDGVEFSIHPDVKKANGTQLAADEIEDSQSLGNGVAVGDIGLEPLEPNADAELIPAIWIVVAEPDIEKADANIDRMKQIVDYEK